MTADPVVSHLIETAAVGCLVNAGSPVEQLSLPGDAWVVHCAVVGRANDIRREEMTAAHGVEWLPVTLGPEEGEVTAGGD